MHYRAKLFSSSSSFLFFDTGLHYAAPGGSGACYVDLAGLILIEMQLPLSQIYIFTCIPYEYLKVNCEPPCI